MIHVEYDEINDKAKMQIEGNLGLIYAELGLVVQKIAEIKDLEMTTDDVIEQIKDAIEYNIKATKKEKKSLFDDSFIEKIKLGRKIYTVRNKPLNLGIYKISKNLSIEIVECKKVQVSYHKYFNHDDIEFYSQQYPTMGSSINTKFGFDTKQEMVDFYKNYLKTPSPYLMKFKVIS